MPPLSYRHRKQLAYGIRKSNAEERRKVGQKKQKKTKKPLENTSIDGVAWRGWPVKDD